VPALETGLEPQRIAELRGEKERLEAALEEAGLATPAVSMDDVAEALRHLPDLSAELRAAPTELKRQAFEAFGPRIAYDKLERRVTISATGSETVANALYNARDLTEEVHRVAQRDIAGARYVPPSDGRIVERIRLNTRRRLSRPEPQIVWPLTCRNASG